MAFGQLDGNSAPQPMSEINMTPLVDVMLVLLIIFIVTAPLLSRSVKVSLPKANAKAAATKEPVVISLDRSLQLFLNDKPVTSEGLTAALQAKAGSEQPAVELHVDGDIAYQHVVRLMALVQNVGITKLSFVTEPHKAGPPGRI
jgi:biopolymer transport protein ExbD